MSFCISYIWLLVLLLYVKTKERRGHREKTCHADSIVLFKPLRGRVKRCTNWSQMGREIGYLSTTHLMVANMPSTRLFLFKIVSAQIIQTES